MSEMADELDINLVLKFNIGKVAAILYDDYELDQQMTPMAYHYGVKILNHESHRTTVNQVRAEDSVVQAVLITCFDRSLFQMKDDACAYVFHQFVDMLLNFAVDPCLVWKYCMVLLGSQKPTLALSNKAENWLVKAYKPLVMGVAHGLLKLGHSNRFMEYVDACKGHLDQDIIPTGSEPLILEVQEHYNWDVFEHLVTHHRLFPLRQRSTPLCGFLFTAPAKDLAKIYQALPIDDVKTLMLFILKYYADLSHADPIGLVCAYFHQVGLYTSRLTREVLDVNGICREYAHRMGFCTNLRLYENNKEAFRWLFIAILKDKSFHIPENIHPFWENYSNLLQHVIHNKPLKLVSKGMDAFKEVMDELENLQSGLTTSITSTCIELMRALNLEYKDCLCTILCIAITFYIKNRHPVILCFIKSILLQASLDRMGTMRLYCEHIGSHLPMGPIYTRDDVRCLIAKAIIYTEDATPVGFTEEKKWQAILEQATPHLVEVRNQYYVLKKRMNDAMHLSRDVLSPTINLYIKVPAERSKHIIRQSSWFTELAFNWSGVTSPV